MISFLFSNASFNSNLVLYSMNFVGEYFILYQCSWKKQFKPYFTVNRTINPQNNSKNEFLDIKNLWLEPVLNTTCKKLA